jgi:hypothetical protein
MTTLLKIVFALQTSPNKTAHEFVTALIFRSISLRLNNSYVLSRYRTENTASPLQTPVGNFYLVKCSPFTPGIIGNHTYAV